MRTDTLINRFFHLLFYRFQNRLPIKTQLAFLEKIDKLLSNGYTIMHSLSVIEWDDKLINPAQSITESLKSGLPVDEAFERASFDEEVVTYLYFARQSGDLTFILNQCSQMMNNRLKSVRKFKQASSYPLLLIFISLILLWFVKTSVYPAFFELFASSGSVSPVLNYAMTAIDLLFLILSTAIFLAIIMVPLSIFIKNHADIDFQLQFYRRIPIYRSYLKKKVTFLFSLHLSSLFHAGLSPKQAFQALNHQNKQPILRYYAEQIMLDLEHGIPLPQILSAFYFLENDLQSIFQRHSTIQWIEKDLSTYADFLVEQMQEQIKKAAGFIQPAVFCLLGFLIVFVYLSIMLPMFQLINSI